MSTRVEIPCPRCAGRGGSPHWKPDAGICYRCRGVCTVLVDIEKCEAALRHLRAKYVALRQSLRAQTHDVEWTRELLRYCVEDGLRLRATIEAAKAAPK